MAGRACWIAEGEASVRAGVRHSLSAFTVRARRRPRVASAHTGGSRCWRRSRGARRHAVTGREHTSRACRPRICRIVQDERYFDELVRPQVDGDRVLFLGSAGPAQRAEVLGSAAVLLQRAARQSVALIQIGTPADTRRDHSLPSVSVTTTQPPRVACAPTASITRRAASSSRLDAQLRAVVQ